MSMTIGRPIRDWLMAVGAVSAAWLVLAWPWLVGGLTIPWDAKLHFQAVLRWLADHLAAGDWPMWMPESFGGRPALGDPQSMMLSPGFLLMAALNPDPSARAGDAVVLTSLLVGGLATALFGLRRGWHPAAAVLAALVMMVGASASGRLQHTLLVLSHAFVPVALLALDAALDRPRPWRSILAGIAIGGLAVGRDQVAYLGLIGLVAFVAARVLAAPDRPAFLRERLISGVLAVLAAGLIAAIPILATIEFAAISNRPAFNFEVGAWQSMPPAAFLTALIPDIFGSLSDATYWGPGSEPWTPWIPMDRTLIQLYVGAAPVVLVLWIGVLRGRLLRGEGLLLAALGLFYAVYAVGHYTPAFKLLFDYLPGVDKFRRPSDATYAFGAVMALSAGWLLDRVLREGLPSASARRRAVEAVAVAALIATAAWVAWDRERLLQSLPALGLSLALSAVAVVLITGAVQAEGRAWRRLALAVLVLMTVADLRVFNVGTSLNAQPVGSFALLDDPDDVPLAAWLEREVAAIEAREGPVRVEVLGLGGEWQNAPMALGVEGTLGYNPLRLADYDAAVGAGQNSHWFLIRKFGSLMTGYRSDFADLLGVRLIVLGAPMDKVDPWSVVSFGPPRRVGNAWVYENRRALPRALYVGREGAHAYDPEAMIKDGGLPPLDWRREALIDPIPPAGDPAAPLLAHPESGSAGSVRIVGRGSDLVELEVDAARDGFVILHDISFPGWVVYVDGERQEPLRANVLFMAAPVPAGRHSVAFAYEPLAPDHLWALLTGDDE